MNGKAYMSEQLKDWVLLPEKFQVGLDCLDIVDNYSEQRARLSNLKNTSVERALCCLFTNT